VSLADDLTVLDRGHQGYGGDVGAQWDRVDPKTKALTGANLHLVLLLSLSAPSCQIQSACRVLNAPLGQVFIDMHRRSGCVLRLWLA
jgi:hypothetical protein